MKFFFDGSDNDTRVSFESKGAAKGDLARVVPLGYGYGGAVEARRHFHSKAGREASRLKPTARQMNEGAVRTVRNCRLEVGP